jgi:hypothetical protein
MNQSSDAVRRLSIHYYPNTPRTAQVQAIMMNTATDHLKKNTRLGCHIELGPKTRSPKTKVQSMDAFKGAPSPSNARKSRIQAVSSQRSKPPRQNTSQVGILQDGTQENTFGKSIAVAVQIQTPPLPPANSRRDHSISVRSR